MISLAMLSLFSGWVLGQFFKVFVLFPAIGLLIPTVLAFSVSLGDSPYQTILKIAVTVWLMPVGYASGEMLLNFPRILRSRRKAWTDGTARLRAKGD